MKKISSIFIAGLALMSSVMAQTAQEALLLSQYYSGGTARSVGMSGAFGALGGDLSTLSFNPAGIGVYRGSEFTFTPSLNFSRTNATFDGNTFKDNNSRVKINNIGYVYTWDLNNSSGFQSLTFGLAYNRLANFDQDIYIRHRNTESSMLDEFVWNANNGGANGEPNKLNDFYERVAWETYAISFDEDKGIYFRDYNSEGHNEAMTRAAAVRGGIGEYDFSLGANLNHMLYFGATLGIQDIYYEESYVHEETPATEYLDYFRFRDDYIMNGTGLNFKAGVIFKPIQQLRLGLSVHTPTYYWLRSEMETEMETEFYKAPPEDPNGKKEFSDGAYTDPAEKFNITSPWRFNASAAVVLSEFWLLGLEAEFINYSKADISSNFKEDDSRENDWISSNYKNTANLKIGTEFRLNSVYLRGGVAFYGSPYKTNVLTGRNNGFTDNGTMSYSAGIGYRARSFYIDAAYSYTKYPESGYTLYALNDQFEERATLKQLANKVVLTFGFRF